MQSKKNQQAYRLQMLVASEKDRLYLFTLMAKIAYCSIQGVLSIF